MPVCDVDLRTGGTFHYVWRNDTNGKEFGISGVFHEVARPERTVYGEKFDWDPGEALVTTSFAERGGSTALTMTMSFESREARDMALESGMEHGVAASYDRLDNLMNQAAV